MLQTLLSYLTMYGLESNIMIANGAGALEFQREKIYKSFRYIHALFIVLGVCIVSFAVYFLNKFVYTKFDLEFVNITVIILLTSIYNFIISSIWKKISNFSYYLYNSSYSFAIDLVYISTTVLMLDLSVSIASFAMGLVAVTAVIIAMNALFGFYVRSFNRGYMHIKFRNVASRLFLMAFFSVLLYYAALLV